MALQYKTVATNSTAGPIINSITLSDIESLMSNPNGRYNIVSQQLTKVLDSQPEGTRVQLVLTKLRDPFGNSQASALGQALQTQFEYGTLKDPATGEPVLAWPEYPVQIAWADDATATLTIRWIKGVVELAPILWALLVGVVIGIVIIEMLRNSPYKATTATNAVSGGGIIGIGASGPTIFGVPVWPNAVLIGTGIALLPAGIGYYGRVQKSRAAAIEGEREFERAERGEG